MLESQANICNENETVPAAYFLVQHPPYFLYGTYVFSFLVSAQ